MLVVTGVVELPENGVDVMKQAAVDMGRASRAEDGCYAYAFWQDLETPTRFRVYEEWRDQAALTAHAQTPHMATFRAALATVGVVSRDIVSFQAGPTTAL